MRRWYVTMTWDGFPEGGSYGTIVEAPDYAVAEAMVREEMAEVATVDDEPEDHDCETVQEMIDQYQEQYSDEWHVIDCFDLDEFVARHLQTVPNGDRP